MNNPPSVPQAARRARPRAVTLSVVMPKALASRVRDQAKSERRSASAHMVMLIEKGLAAEGAAA